jgi:hypothetical protein
LVFFVPVQLNSKQAAQGRTVAAVSYKSHTNRMTESEFATQAWIPVLGGHKEIWKGDDEF